jgi:hypothetical protein
MTVQRSPLPVRLRAAPAREVESLLVAADLQNLLVSTPFVRAQWLRRRREPTFRPRHESQARGRLKSPGDFAEPPGV